jgi:hypothetical protein
VNATQSPTFGKSLGLSAVLMIFAATFPKMNVSPIAME